MIFGRALCFAITVSGVFASTDNGPDVSAVIDSSTVTVGDPIQLTLFLKLGAFEKFDAQTAFKALESFSPLWKSSSGHVDAQEVSIQYELRLYRVGEFQVPPLPITFVAADGDTSIKFSNPVNIRVASVREAGELEPTGLRPPKQIPGGIPLWLAGMLAAAVAVGILGLIYWLVSRRRKESDVVPPPPPSVDYAAEFVRIAGMGLLEAGEFKRFYSLLSENLRRFLNVTLQVDTMERTTDEILEELKSHPKVDLQIYDNIECYLLTADLVKFAKYVPAINNAKRATESGVSIVGKIEAAMPPLPTDSETMQQRG